MSENEGVTVIIPCFNQGRFLRDCIASLERQTRPFSRAVIVDDASTDRETARLCDAERSDRVTVIHLTENVGLPGARDVGIRLAETEAIMNVDADDMLEPEHLARTAPLLFEDPRRGVVYTDYRRFGAAEGVMRGKPFDATLLYTHQYIYGCNLYRRSAYHRTAGYRRELKMGNEDWDFWISLVEAGYTGLYVPEPLYLYRVHAGSWSSQDPRARAKAIRDSRELIRDFHREGYERSGQLARFDRDTDLAYGRLMLLGGDVAEARRSLLRAMWRWPASVEPARLLLRSLFGRATRKPGP